MKKINSFFLFACAMLVLASCKKNIDNTGTGEFAPIAYLPTVITTDISSVNSNSARTGGMVLDSGNVLITGRGVVYGRDHNPTLADTVVPAVANTLSFTALLSNLDENVTYFVRAYVTNDAGTTYGNEISFRTHVVAGELYKGGIVFFINNRGDHGYIVAPNDLPDTFQWGCNGMPIPGIDTGAVGDGKSNSDTVAQLCSGSAASACENLNLNLYDDWFLPSISELNLLYEQRRVVANLFKGKYWSSTSIDSTHAYYEDFANGTPFTVSRDAFAKVRPIRYF